MRTLVKPSAAFFDLDDTLLQRSASVAHWNVRLAHDFAAQLEPLGEEELVRTIWALACTCDVDEKVQCVIELRLSLRVKWLKKRWEAA